MMAIQELRLGNVVFANNKVREIVSIYPNGIDYVEKDEVYFALLADLSPIQITQEWLERLGFESLFYADKTFADAVLDGEFVLSQESYLKADNLWLLSSRNSNVTAVIRYVHELQNIYYFHKNQKKELTIGGGE